jgi:hypothetical protein
MSRSKFTEEERKKREEKKRIREQKKLKRIISKQIKKIKIKFYLFNFII